MGDAMTTRSVTTGIVGPALGPFTVDPAGAVASLDALDGLSASWVLPGHGDAWTGGLPEALRLIRAAWAKRAADLDPPQRRRQPMRSARDTMIPSGPRT